MHTAALGKILNPSCISHNCGGFCCITRNGGDKTSFFFLRWWLPPYGDGGRGVNCTRNPEQHTKKNASWLVRAVWAVLPKNRTRIVGIEWLSLRCYHSPLRNPPPVTNREAFEIARRPTGAEQSLWAFWMILLNCIFWFIFYKKRR